MIRRIIIATVAVSFAASIAFSQMRYSRPKSSAQSPTPTPTPLPLIPAQKTTLAPRGTPVPIQTKATPIPLQRTMAATNQPKATPPPAMRMPAKPNPTFAPIPPKLVAEPTPAPAKPTPTPVPPPDVKAYLDRQLAKSKDQKFHMTVNGGDLALTPFHVWAQKSTGPNTTSTSISMRSDEGRVYDIDFLTTGAQVTSIQIRRINGEAVR